jgi:hypothetical protein
MTGSPVPDIYHVPARSEEPPSTAQPAAAATLAGWSCSFRLAKKSQREIEDLSLDLIAGPESINLR